MSGTESRFGVKSGSEIEEGRGMSRIAVVGAGAWGTALAISLARRGGHSVALWSFLPELTQEMKQIGVNSLFLPGYTVPADVQVTSDLAVAVKAADIVLLVTPSEHLRGVFRSDCPAADAAADTGQRHQRTGGKQPAAHVASYCLHHPESLRSA